MRPKLTKECLDRVGAALAAVAGVAAAIATSPVSSVAIGAGLIAAACSGRAALLNRLGEQEVDAAKQIQRFIDELGESWQQWASTSESAARTPEDLEAAVYAFEAYFKSAGDKHLPTPDEIIATGLDARRLADLMLERAAKAAPHDYAEPNALNRGFFTRVVHGAFAKLIERPAFVATLQPAFVRLVTRKLERIEAGTDAIGADVRKLLEQAEGSPQPALDRPPTSEAMNHFAARRIDVLGRDDEMAKLHRFVAGGAGFRWLQLAGEAGQGKSRLALELVRSVDPDRSTIGYLGSQALKDFENEWRVWQPPRPHLIVIDYLVGLESSVKPLMQALSRRRDELAVPVRLLLVERQRWDRGGGPAANTAAPGDAGSRAISAGTGRAEWFLRIAERHDGEDPELAGARFEDGVVDLEALEASDRIAIVRQVAALTGQKVEADDEAIGNHLARIDPSGRPLYAYFLGQSLGEGRPVGVWSRADLLDDVLNREYCRRWKAALNDEPPALGDDAPAMRLALLATMTGHVDCRCVTKASGWVTPDRGVRRAALILTDGPRGEGARGPGQIIPALQPDLLGEWFVLAALDEGAPLQALADAAWKISPEGMAAFLVRLAQDFPEHEGCVRLLDHVPPTPASADACAGVASHILFAMWKAGPALPVGVVRALRHAAEMGDGMAMTNLAFCYANGRGVERDKAQEVAWYRKGAAAGDGTAMTNLGFCYEYGTGVEQDEAQAVAWYRKGAAAGDGMAAYNLGQCYEYGTGVERNEEQAVAWYRMGATAGIGLAMFNLGFCYETGTGVERDEAQAVSWYRRGAAAGNAYARSALAATLFAQNSPVRPASGLTCPAIQLVGTVDAWDSTLNWLAWRALGPDEAAVCLDRAVAAIAEERGERLSASLVARAVRAAALAWYPGVELVEFIFERPSDATDWILTSLVSEQSALPLDGNKLRLKCPNRYLLRLKSETAALDYLRFYSEFSRAEEDSFHVIARPDQLPIPAGQLSSSVAETLRSVVTAPRPIEAMTKGLGACFECVMVHGRTLFRVHLGVGRDGMVKILDGETLILDLPITPRVFEGFLRSVRRHDRGPADRQDPPA